MSKLKLLLGVLVVTLLLGVAAYRVFDAISGPVLAPAACPAPNGAPTPPAAVTAADFMALGDWDFDRGKCDQAIVDYGRAIALNPQLAEAYNNRAYTYMLQQNYAAALPDLDQAIALRPNYINALTNRGDIYNYYYNVDPDKAIADYNRVIAIDPSHTAVCGHLTLAQNHGWNLRTLISVVRQVPAAVRGPVAGCG